jgi:hypothetical protein
MRFRFVFLSKSIYGGLQRSTVAGIDGQNQQALFPLLDANASSLVKQAYSQLVQGPAELAQLLALSFAVDQSLDDQGNGLTVLIQDTNRRTRAS